MKNSVLPLRAVFGAVLVVAMVFAKLTTASAMTKKMSEYWADTHLSFSEIQRKVNSDSCYQDKNLRIFYACIEAVQNLLSYDAPSLQLSPTADLKTQKVEVSFGIVSIIQARNTLEDMATATVSQFLEDKKQQENLRGEWKKIFESGPKVYFSSIMEWIRSHRVKPEFESVLTAQALNAYLGVSHDPHSYFYPAELHREETQSGPSLKDIIVGGDKKNPPPQNEGELESFYGVGLKVEKSKDRFRVLSTTEGGAADKGGIRAGDLIASVDGVDSRTLSQSDLVNKIRGPENTAVKLEIIRGDKTLSFQIPREKITIKVVESQVVHSQEKNFGLLSLKTFDNIYTCTKTKEAIQLLLTDHLDGLILDLRGNPGGLMMESLCVAGIFVGAAVPILTEREIDTGKVISTETSPFIKKYPDDSPITDLPLVILQDNLSASASEILSGALQDYRRAYIVGETSFGKGSVQTEVDSGFGPDILFFETRSRFYQPSGRTNQIVGIQPDFPIEKVVHPDDSALRILREADAYAFALPRTSKDWVQTRKSEIAELDACTKSQQEKSAATQDEDLSKALAILSCVNNSAADPELSDRKILTDKEIFDFGLLLSLAYFDDTRIEREKPFLDQIVRDDRKILPSQLATILRKYSGDDQKTEELKFWVPRMLIPKFNHDLPKVLQAYNSVDAQWKAAEILLSREVSNPH